MTAQLGNFYKNSNMKLLLNDKEIARFLIALVNVRDSCVDIEMNERHTAEQIHWVIEIRDKPKFNLEKHRDKIKQKITQGVRKDLKAWIDTVKTQIANHKQYFYKNIYQHLEIFIDRLDQEQIFQHYLTHPTQGFIKTVGLQIDPTATMIRRKNFVDSTEDCLLRNTVGNENIIVDKINRNLPFWFIDSGYTNFVESNKKWHRLVRNHLHFNSQFIAPVDRLKHFKQFPQPWRKDGKKILIVQPGEFAASIMNIDVKSWTEKVVKELRTYTDRPIVIRSKTNKKTRTSLYKTLVNGDYYCTVSINSNSAVESIWAGIPAITLDKHVSNTVTRSSLSQIDDLYYGPLGDWLAWLSYCQFTYDELMDGTALNIIKKYHNV
jgi:hypothetical protein